MIELDSLQKALSACGLPTLFSRLPWVLRVQAYEAFSPGVAQSIQRLALMGDRAVLLQPEGTVSEDCLLVDNTYTFSSPR